MPTHYCEDQDNVTVSQSEARSVELLSHYRYLDLYPSNKKHLSLLHDYREHNIKPKENENSFYPILPLSRSVKHYYLQNY